MYFVGRLQNDSGLISYIKNSRTPPTQFGGFSALPGTGTNLVDFLRYNPTFFCRMVNPWGSSCPTWSPSSDRWGPSPRRWLRWLPPSPPSPTSRPSGRIHSTRWFGASHQTEVKILILLFRWGSGSAWIVVHSILGYSDLVDLNTRHFLQKSRSLSMVADPCYFGKLCELEWKFGYGSKFGSFRGLKWSRGGTVRTRNGGLKAHNGALEGL